METIEFKKLIEDIGNTVHSMNSIAVALSVMPNTEFEVPEDLDVSWKPKSIEESKKRARNFAGRSAYVYVAENLFEYLDDISKNPLWKYPNINFKGEEKKAIKVYNFLSNIPGLSIENAILSELICHWRNKIIHASTSNANLSSNKRDILSTKKDEIYDSFHHFDISIAMSNYTSKKITLKDVSTLTTIVIKCCRAVDEYYFEGLSKISDFSEYEEIFALNIDFKDIYTQPKSAKRNRQIEKWLRLNYPYMEEYKLQNLLEVLIAKSLSESKLR
jgi:hypothetical protein